MHSKFDLISGLRIYNEKLIIIRKKYFFSFFSLLFLLFFLFGFLYVESVQAAVKEDNQLIEKVSKDYTKKFCNSIAFGLSKESAMEFSAKENNLIFRNRKGFDDISSDLIANKIAISVVEDCGYLIDLRGNDGINGFENDYKILLKKAQIKTN
tara:strand:- start:1773 stop:2231 length:459 start_codon:yes stop_codon:yes gene_type:complete